MKRTPALIAAMLCFAAHASDTGIATSAAPTYTDKTVEPLSLDLSGNLRTTATVSGGSITVVPQRGATATSTSVAQTGSSVTALAANTNRIEAVITNTTGVTCNLGLGTTASATTGPVLLANAVYIENAYTGAINSLCASGNLAVTEITP